MTILNKLRSLFRPAAAASNATPEKGVASPTGGDPRPARRRRPLSGRLGNALKLIGVGIGGIVAAITLVLFITWDADLWEVRDRVEHIRQALFGEYVPRQCRQDPARCRRDEKTGRLVPKSSSVIQPSADCHGPEGLRLHCQLHTLFDHFNTELFDGRLPRAVITLQRKPGTGGYYAHRRFRKADGGHIDEIAMNPSLFGKRSMLWLASVLVHEMTHMERAYFGESGPPGDHDAEWAQMMKRVGLNPSNTGLPGGAETGPRMSHYVIPGGAFERAASRHPLLQNDRLAFYE